MDKLSRRDLLKSGGTACLVAVTGCIGPDNGSDEPNSNRDNQTLKSEVDSYLSDVGNYNGEIKDKKGESQIQVLNGNVGSVDTNQPYVFEPPALQIDTGTTIIWKWQEGGHSVRESQGLFDSTVRGDGAEFRYQFDEEGLYKYYCTPHRTIGHKGVIVVGEEIESE